jgi:hypothetical protein
MHVVVKVEAAIVRRRDVGIRLDRMTDVINSLPYEIDERRPKPVQPLKNDGGTGSEQAEHLGRIDLIGDFGAEAGGTEIAVLGQDLALLGQPDERGAYPALCDELVDHIGRQQITEVTG